MWVAVILSTVLGLIVGRSVVAETSAHRRELPDRWWDPQCDECSGRLNLLMTRCGPEGHPQRLVAPLTPIVTSGMFVAFTLSVPSLWVLPGYLVFAAAMVALTITDLETKLIPNRILGPSTAVATTLLIVGGLVSSQYSALVWAGVGGIGYFAVMFLLALVARGGLGFGDVKLAFIIGVFTGYLSWGHVIVAGIGSFLVGGIVAVILLVTRRSSRKDAIPFGPFMTTAAIVAIVVGDSIITWYVP